MQNPSSSPVFVLTEAEFRQKVQATLDRIEAAFDAVDPDVAECSQALGALTITFGDGSRCILSTQPSVRQLWLALASRAIAYHFNCEQDPAGDGYRWVDDKGQGVELIGFLETFIRESTGADFAIRR